MWKEGSVLQYLKVFSNAADIIGFAYIFWTSSRSKLDTLNMANIARQGMCAPTRLLIFLPANHFLEQPDVRGTIFGTDFDEGEVG